MAASAVVSIHDVTPEALPCVQGILNLTESLGIRDIALLVVPGLGWNEKTIATLRLLQERGYNLAGHGWNHRAVSKKDLRHKIHSAVFSRDAAEHLSRPRPEVVSLINRSHKWFQKNGLSSPSLYVPPAWAMGDIDAQTLKNLPYKQYETLSTVHNAAAGESVRLPLAGFQADTLAREAFLRSANPLNALAARATGAPLRIAIHPRDLQLRLSNSLRKYLGGPWQFLPYSAITHNCSRIP